MNVSGSWAYDDYRFTFVMPGGAVRHVTFENWPAHSVQGTFSMFGTMFDHGLWVSTALSSIAPFEASRANADRSLDFVPVSMTLEVWRG